MGKTNYILDIYVPNNADETMASFEGETPFQAFGKGDLLDAAHWKDISPEERFLQVRSVEHIIYEVEGDNVDKLVVRTEFAPKS